MWRRLRGCEPSEVADGADVLFGELPPSRAAIALSMRSLSALNSPITCSVSKVISFVLEKRNCSRPSFEVPVTGQDKEALCVLLGVCAWVSSHFRQRKPDASTGSFNSLIATVQHSTRASETVLRSRRLPPARRSCDTESNWSPIERK